MIGQRLLLARKASGLSQEKLGKAVGVSANMIKKYEHDLSMPSSSILLKLSEALSTRIEFFFRPINVELTGIEYRKKTKTPSKLLKRIEADVLDQAERWLELANLWTNFPISKFKIDMDVPVVKKLDDIENIANDLREYWKLGTNPIPNLIDLLESKGILVIVTDVIDEENSNCFDGLQATVNDMPIIVVGDGWTGDRQRFTLAHELGHLVLQGKLSDDIDEEKACHRFASAFLVPAKELKDILGSQRKNISPRELGYIKHEFGISMSACLYRLKDLEIITESKHKQYMYLFSKKGWRKQEPGEHYPVETTYLFPQLVHRAISEGIISESKGAELLKISTFELQRKRIFEDISMTDSLTEAG